MAEELALLARQLARQGRLEQADSLARAALDMTVRTLGAAHPAVASARLPVLAEVLEQQGRHDEADRTYRDAFDQIRLQGAVPGQMRRDYGRMLMRRGDYPDAERELLQSLALLERAYAGQEHPNVHETRRALMELYQRWDKPELAERFRVPPGRFVPY